MKDLKQHYTDVIGNWIEEQMSKDAQFRNVDFDSLILNLGVKFSELGVIEKEHYTDLSYGKNKEIEGYQEQIAFLNKKLELVNESTNKMIEIIKKVEENETLLRQSYAKVIVPKRLIDIVSEIKIVTKGVSRISVEIE